MCNFSLLANSISFYKIKPSNLLNFKIKLNKNSKLGDSDLRQTWDYHKEVIPLYHYLEMCYLEYLHQIVVIQ